MSAKQPKAAIDLAQLVNQTTDRFVAGRLRARRLMLGLTQQEMAERIGVTFQQAHKYETGMNRISAGRLYQIARAMQVDVSFFFEGLAEAPTGHRPGQDRMMLDLSRNFIRISNAAQQAALCHFAHVLAHSEPGPGQNSGMLAQS